MSISNGLHNQHTHSDDTASDDEDEYEPHDATYQPISAFDDGSDSDDHGVGNHDAASPIPSNGGGVGLFHLQNPNPSVLFLDAEGTLSAMDLNGGGRSLDYGGGYEEEPDNGDAEEEEEERVRQLEESISTAFSEDERRRSAPLTPENAARVLAAMRGVAFQGIAPDWAAQVSDDQWVDRLTRLRGESSSTV